MSGVDVLAIFAHRDDAELTCGGTLAKLARAGRRTGILDLTQGEMGTRGSAATREDEAAKAAKVLGVAVRENLALPDAGVANTAETRRALGAVIRRLRPQVVIAPAQDGRHPDHRVAAELVRDACFLSGLAKFDAGHIAHRPRKILHSITYREDHLKPTFVVDISAEFETKLEAVRCYASQFDGATGAGEVYPNGEPLYEIVRHQAAHYGSLIRCRYGEPFYTTETMRVDDVMALEVSTF
ncbi:MAG: bacillithiol biosynthesis deacetylase BshB1 [Gemmatimonadales bacterium]|jgi:bacillithiol biosynthesis deacetylase BshB1